MCPKLAYAALIWSPYCLKSDSTSGESTYTEEGSPLDMQGGVTLEVLVRCSMSCNGQLFQRPRVTSPLYFSSTNFIVRLQCMSIDKDKYLTPSHSTRFTRSSHNSQYYRPQAYSEVLKLSFFPVPFPSPRKREVETQKTDSHGTINVNQQAFFSLARYYKRKKWKGHQEPRHKTSIQHKTLAFNGSNSKQCINKNIITPSIGQQPLAAA